MCPKIILITNPLIILPEISQNVSCFFKVQSNDWFFNFIRGSYSGGIPCSSELSGYTFFIGNSIFHLSLELLTKFWKTSLNIVLLVLGFYEFFIGSILNLVVFRDLRYSSISFQRVFWGEMFIQDVQEHPVVRAIIWIVNTFGEDKLS